MRGATFAKAAKAAFAVFAVCAFAAAAPTPEEVGADLAARKDLLIGELRHLREDGALSPDSALALIQKDFSPLVNFSRLAGQAAGKYWRRAKDEEKARITAAFRKILEGVYAKVLARYSDQKVALVESKLRGDGTILVKMEGRDGERSARIHYVFFETDGAMKITDVLVEDVSLLDTYRRQFAQIAKKEGTAGLAARLEELAQR